ncbi:MAG TPA: HEAT repeat domain-containing protein [Acidimicrobiales bacterium]|nr:HEAT repeat domain-containing protein [Acidimicrobiales bacterium]
MPSPVNIGGGRHPGPLRIDAIGKYDGVRDRTGWGIPGQFDAGRTGDDVAELIELSYDPDPKARKIAVVNLCPCHVRADFPQAWDRVLEMADDLDPLVRRAVVHVLADGSPRYRAAGVAGVLDSMRNDPDSAVRRRVRAVLNSYRRTGRINVL